MSIGLIILVFIVYHGVNIVIALINANIVSERIINKNPNQINHFLWSLIYFATIIPIYFLSHSFWLIGGIILLHLSVFPVAYNLFRGLAPFNLSKTSQALTDELMVDLGFKSTEIVNFSAEIIAIALMTISIYA